MTNLQKLAKINEEMRKLLTEVENLRDLGQLLSIPEILSKAEKLQKEGALLISKINAKRSRDHQS
jgi:hypothetical protein